MPYWMNAIGGYTELGDPRRRARPGRDGAQLPARLHRRALVRPRRLLRPRRLRRGDDDQVSSCPSTPLAILVGVVVGTVAAAIIGALIVKLRGVYFAMVTIAFGQVFYFIAFRWNTVTGGDDGLTGWQRQPLDLGFATLDIPATTRRSTTSRSRCFAVAVGVDGAAAALAVRPHADRDPRERAARALPRHPGRAAHLDRRS